jgi:hypothetical protein
MQKQNAVKTTGKTNFQNFGRRLVENSRELSFKRKENSRELSRELSFPITSTIANDFTPPYSETLLPSPKYRYYCLCSRLIVTSTEREPVISAFPRIGDALCKKRQQQKPVLLQVRLVCVCDV